MVVGLSTLSSYTHHHAHSLTILFHEVYLAHDNLIHGSFIPMQCHMYVL